MKIMIAYLIQTFCITCATQSKIELKLETGDTVISCKKDNFRFAYKLANHTKRSIKIPGEAVVMNENGAADVDYVLEQDNDSLNEFVPFKYLLELPAYRVEKYKTLLPGESVFENFSILCQFFSKAIFRVRVKYKLSRFNSWIADTYSNWVRFRVAEVFVPE